jgi:hypothetical protein
MLEIALSWVGPWLGAVQESPLEALAENARARVPQEGPAGATPARLCAFCVRSRSIPAVTVPKTTVLRPFVRE